MNKKLLITVVVLVLLGGYAAYSFAMPKPVIHDKITGTIYLLPRQFLVNLSDGRYGKVTVALVLAPGQSDGGTAEGGTPPPDGFGTLPEEAGGPGHHHEHPHQPERQHADQPDRARPDQGADQAGDPERHRRQGDAVLFTDVAVQ